MMELQIAWRNIWRNPRRTLIIMTAVVIGVVSMMFYTAMVRGMLSDMTENGISTLTGDIKIYPKGYRDDPSVAHRMDHPEQLMRKLRPLLPADGAIACRVRVSAVASNARHSYGVTLVGIDPAQEKSVSFIGNGVEKGEMVSGDNPDGIVIGAALAEKFETRIGHKLILMSENTGNEISSKAFKIIGIYRAKMKSTEQQYMFVGKSAAQNMLKMGDSVSEMAIAFKNHNRAEALAQKIRGVLDAHEYEVYTWRKLLPMLDAYLSVFDGFILIWYFVVFVAMSFGIINTMLMSVFERMQEFGLLKALGMRPVRIVRSVLVESALILVMGVLIGNLLAGGIVYAVSRVGIDLSALAAGFEYAGMSAVIYPEIAIKDVELANVVVIVLGLAVSLYPAVRAGKITPVKAMSRN